MRWAEKVTWGRGLTFHSCIVSYHPSTCTSKQSARIQSTVPNNLITSLAASSCPFSALHPKTQNYSSARNPPSKPRGKNQTKKKKTHQGVPNNSSSSSGSSIPEVCNARYTCSAVIVRIYPRTPFGVLAFFPWDERETGTKSLRGERDVGSGLECVGGLSFARRGWSGMRRCFPRGVEVSQSEGCPGDRTYNFRELVSRSMFLITFSPRAARLTSLSRLG